MEQISTLVTLVLGQGAWIVALLIAGALYVFSVVRSKRELLAVAFGSTLGMTLYLLQDFSVPTFLSMSDALFQHMLAVVLLVGSVVAAWRMLTPLYGNVAGTIVAIATGTVSLGFFVERFFGMPAIPQPLIDLTGSLFALAWWVIVLFLCSIAVFLERRGE
jgi:hypothetical protein